MLGLNIWFAIVPNALAATTPIPSPAPTWPATFPGLEAIAFKTSADCCWAQLMPRVSSAAFWACAPRTVSICFMPIWSYFSRKPFSSSISIAAIENAKHFNPLTCSNSSTFGWIISENSSSRASIPSTSVSDAPSSFATADFILLWNCEIKNLFMSSCVAHWILFPIIVSRNFAEFSTWILYEPRARSFVAIPKTLSRTWMGESVPHLISTLLAFRTKYTTQLKTLIPPEKALRNLLING